MQLNLDDHKMSTTTIFHTSYANHTGMLEQLAMVAMLATIDPTLYTVLHTIVVDTMATFHKTDANHDGIVNLLERGTPGPIRRKISLPVYVDVMAAYVKKKRDQGKTVNEIQISVKSTIDSVKAIPTSESGQKHVSFNI